jgi:hypothetical protein
VSTLTSILAFSWPNSCALGTPHQVCAGHALLLCDGQVPPTYAARADHASFALVAPARTQRSRWTRRSQPRPTLPALEPTAHRSRWRWTRPPGQARVRRAGDGCALPHPKLTLTSPSPCTLCPAPLKLALASPSPCAPHRRRTHPAPPKLALASPSPRTPRWRRSRPAQARACCVCSHAPLRVRVQSSWMCRCNCVIGLFRERG